MKLPAVAALAALVVGCAAQTAVTARFGAINHFVDEAAPGVTFDYWLRNDTNYGEKWMNASILSLDLNKTDVVAAATGLAGGTLRIGGSPVNSIYFDAAGSCNPGGTGPSPTYYCSQVKPYIYGCLTPQRWTEILQFTKKTGIKLLMGMNACYGRTSPSTPMDFSNIKAFLETTKALGDDLLSQLIGFELGNEVILTGGITAQQYAEDAAVIRGMIDDVFGAGRMALAGPADFTAQALDVISDAAPTTFNYTTYHDYPNCLPDATFAMNPSCLSKMDSNANSLSSLVKQQKKPFTVWAGETSDYFRGGEPGVNDAFNDVFYYLWQLSALPLNGVSNAMRQCLIGGDYELVSRFNYSANPSYWAAYLFRKTMPGAATVTVNQTIDYTTSGLRVFGFADAGDLRMAIILNMHRSNAYTVKLPDFPASVDVWRLTATNLTSQQILLNGKPLMFEPNTPTHLPETPWATEANPLSLPPTTALFVKSPPQSRD
ncbi:Heparanase-like protein 3 [Diplonema papillatum]|nr:Heparanase-like protein 3 [Diplonema papillatum]